MELQLQKIAAYLESINDSLNSFLRIWYQDPQWLTAIVTFFALILLFFYTYYTRKIAKATEETLRENMRPIVSCELKSGKNCYSAQEIQSDPSLLHDTRCIVKNHSKYNVEVFVNLNLKINGKSEKINDEYTGKKAWPMTSFQGVNGHFDLSNKLNLQKVKSIILDLEVSYKSDIGKLYKNPIQYWHFNLGEQAWVNDIGVRS